MYVAKVRFTIQNAVIAVMEKSENSLINKIQVDSKYHCEVNVEDFRSIGYWLGDSVRKLKSAKCIDEFKLNFKVFSTKQIIDFSICLSVLSNDKVKDIRFLSTAVTKGILEKEEYFLHEVVSHKLYLVFYVMYNYK